MFSNLPVIVRVYELHVFRFFLVLSAFFASDAAWGADFHPPAGERYALVTASGTVLPGGRILKPWGTELQTGPAPFGLAVSRKGTVATADVGYERFGVTIIDPPGKSWQIDHIWARTPNSKAPERADPEWRGVAYGIAFEADKTVWVSEGDSGKVRLIDTASGDIRGTVNLNDAEWQGSYTGDFAWDAARRFLFVVDQANSRVAAVNAKTRRVVSSTRVGRLPFAIALAPDGSTAYVTVQETNSVCAIDVRDPQKLAAAGCIRTGSGPAGVLAVDDRVFVSNAQDDSITVISARDWKVAAGIPLRIPSLEAFRGIMPAGMAYDPVTKWLLVAEAGINAVAVVDPEKKETLGHIPAGWLPTRVAISGDRVYVANARGRGSGPNLRRPLLDLGETPSLHRGSVTTFIVPGAADLAQQTQMTMAANGFLPDPRDPPKLPAAIRYVVLIVKQNRSFDEVFGDIPKALASPSLARFGMHGRGDGGRGQLSVQDAPVTPNQHAIAQRWAFSDNFYADGDTSAEGDRWLTGAAPDLPSETRLLAAAGGRRAPADELPETETLWRHLERNGVAFRNFGEGIELNISDQQRADQFIAEADRRYIKDGEPWPRFLSIQLPGDRGGEARRADGYPYEASFVAENDLALGRILDYLSYSPWWPAMAVLITEDSAQGGLDHVDAHRTLLLAAGPYVKRNYVSHTNTSFPGLLRTIFELLNLPPLHLMDATAASLAGLFTDTPDLTPYTATPPDARIFDPAR
jgi:DNA-binding beta-propeller fold protein YncE